MKKLEFSLGDSLAQEAMSRTLDIKFQVIGKELQNYYDAFNSSSIDIPEFMKPYQEQTAYKIRTHLINLYHAGTLDYWYQRALEENGGDNNVRL